MKEYILNVKSSMVHKSTCRYVKNLDDVKKKEFYTLDEARKSCKDIKFCKSCKVKEEL